MTKAFPAGCEASTARTPTLAQSVIGAAILRQPQAVIITGQAWDPDIATDGTRRMTQPLAA